MLSGAHLSVYHLPGPQSGLTLTCTQRGSETPRIDVTISRTAVLLVQFYILVSPSLLKLLEDSALLLETSTGSCASKKQHLLLMTPSILPTVCLPSCPLEGTAGTSRTELPGSGAASLVPDSCCLLSVCFHIFNHHNFAKYCAKCLLLFLCI